MATYLPGVTDIGFNPVQYNPNYSLMQQSLEKISTRYETNYKNLMDGYSSIMNAPIINSKYSQKRDQYLNDIKEQLKTISTSDLSIQANVNAAENLYSPFWEDKNMLAHIKDTKERMSELQKQEQIAKDHPDYDNSTAQYVMNYNMNQIKNSTDPNIINSVSKVNAVALPNNPKEFQEWIKKNDWEVNFDVSKNGYIYKQKNGKDTDKTFYDLFQTYLGKGATDQYQMYGEYYKIQGIENIKAEKKLNGIDISNEEAIKLLPDYYSSEQIKSYNKQLTALNASYELADNNADNAFKAGDDIGLSEYLRQMKDANDRIGTIKKQINLFSTKGAGSEEDKKQYDELVKSISINPAGFFAQIQMNTDAETASKMAASRQSLSISNDQAYLTMWKEQQEAARWAQTFALEVRKQDFEESKPIKGAKDISLSSGKVEYNSDGTVKSFENILPIVTAGENNNKLETAITTFESNVQSLQNTGLKEMIEVLQSAKSNVLSKIASPQEVSQLYSAYSKNEFGENYKTNFTKIKKNLEANGVDVKNINGPIGVFTALSDYYTNAINKDVAIQNENLKNNTYDKDLAAKILTNYQDMSRLSEARLKLNNAYAYKKQFDENVNARILNDIKSGRNTYKDIAIKKADGSYAGELITAQNLSKYAVVYIDGKKAKLPYDIAQAYVNGTLKDDPENIYHYNPYDTQGSGRTKVGTKYVVKDKSGQDVDITNVVNQYGRSKQLREKLDKGLEKFKQDIPSSIQKSILEQTGKMGKVITYTSNPGSEKDYADDLARNFFANLNFNVVQKDDKYNLVGVNDDQSKLLQKLIKDINSNPTAGLTSIKFHTIGGGDPTKRNVTLVYDKETLLKGIDKKDRSDYDFFNGEITFEIKDNATIKGFPASYNDSFYTLLLNSNNSGTIKQTPEDENMGLKYELYKDADNNIRFKAGYKLVTRDEKTNTASYDWVNYDKSSKYDDVGGFEILPPYTTVEDFIQTLRTNVITQATINSQQLQKTYDPKMQPDYAKKEILQKLNAERLNIKRN